MRQIVRILFLMSILLWVNTQDVQALSEMDYHQMIQGIETMFDANPQYRITYKWTNLRSIHTTATVTVIGNSQTQQQKIILDYYYRDKAIPHVRLEMMAYDNFQRVYVKNNRLLHDLRISDEQPFQDENGYVRLTSQQVKGLMYSEQWQDALFLRPNWKKISPFLQDSVYQLDDWHTAMLTAPHIPEQLFDTQQLINFHYDMALSALDNGEYQPIPSLEVQLNKQNMTWNTMLQSPTHMNLPNMQFETSTLFEKLKKMTLTYQANESIYRLRLEGIVELVHLNVFQLQTAHIKTYDYRLDYELRPSNEVLPEESNLNIHSFDTN